MPYFKVGDRVEVNKDIFRTEEISKEKDTSKIKEIEEAVNKLSSSIPMDKMKLVQSLFSANIIPWNVALYLEGANVSIDGICRNEIKYASKGESGFIVDLFKSENEEWHAKVLMGSVKRTFRLTSLTKIT